MISILFYLLKVVLCSTFLYAYYCFILRNKQFHQYNRFYLMGISVISWMVPFIKIEIVKEQVTVAPKVLHFATTIAESNSSIEREVIEQSAQFSWDNLILFGAIGISVVFILRFIKSLWNIKKLIRSYPLREFLGLYLVMTDVKGTPFSFFKYVFWNKSIDLNSEVGKKILAHEVAHVEENHSFDKLLIELQLIIGWFNPIIWLIRKELYLIHEFIADKKSIVNNDVTVLAELLLASAYPSQHHLLSNSFFFSPIKRRIKMFTKTNTKYYVFHVNFVFHSICTRQNKNKTKQDKSKNKTTTKTIICMFIIIHDYDSRDSIEKEKKSCHREKQQKNKITFLFCTCFLVVYRKYQNIVTK